MSLTKAKGNMYEWCSHTHSYLRGKCPHGCTYCYVQAMCARFPNMRKRYSGQVEFDHEQLNVHSILRQQGATPRSAGWTGLPYSSSI